FPAEYIDLMRRAGRMANEMALRLPGSLLTLDERVDLLTEVGIDMQVLSVAQRQPSLPKEADAVEAARLVNDIYADVCRRYPAPFTASGAIPLPHGDAAVAEGERCVGSLGMVGITLGCSIFGRPLDDPAFEPFWAELNRRGTVVFLHPIGMGVLEGDD